MKLDLSVRTRLTLIYGGLFLATGALLLTINYALVRRSLEADRIAVVEQVPTFGPFVSRPDPLEREALLRAIRQYGDEVRQAALRDLLARSIQALAVMTAVAGALGWMVAGRVLAPLDRITETARRASEQRLDERIGLVGPDDELKRLADTLDDMLGRLESSFDSQRRFVANASHELRTPLAVMRTEIDVALADADADVDDLRAMAERVRGALGRGERLIESLLMLARSDRGPAVQEPVDLADLAGDALVQAGAPATEAGLDLTSRLDPAPTTGDPTLLGRLAANLVENAVRYNELGGTVEVETATDGDAAVLRVRNTGPVVAEAEVDTLFEAFRRGRHERLHGDGVGLGLSIVRSVAAAHGGRVEARPRSAGGLDVEVRLPRSV